MTRKLRDQADTAFDRRARRGLTGLIVVIALVVGGLVATATPAFAAACSWKTSPVDTNFNNGSNWTGCTGTGGIPAAADDLTIPSGASAYPVLSTGTGNARTISVASSASLTVSGGTLVIANNTGITNNGTLTVSGTGVLSAAGRAINNNSGATFTHSSSGSSTIGTLTNAGTVNLTGGTLSTGTAATNTGTFTVNGGTFSITTAVAFTNTSPGTVDIQSGTFQWTVSGGTSDYRGTGTTTMEGGTLKLGHDFQADKLSATGGLVEYAGASGAGNLGGTGPYQFFNIQLDSGGFQTAGATAFSVAGNWTTNGAAAAVTSNDTVTFNGTSAQTIGGAFATTFGLVVINNAGGVSITQSDAITTTLTFTLGKLTTGANVLTVGTNATTGSVVGASQSTGWIVGNEKRFIGNDTTARTFDVGVASFYAPGTLAALGAGFNGTANGTSALTVGAVSGEHAQVGTSGINSASDVNNYWSVSGTGNGNVPAAGYSFKGAFQTGDRDAGSNPASFVMRRWNGTAWVSPAAGTTVDNTNDTTANFTFAGNTGINVASTFGDFVIGNTGTAAPSVTVQSSANPSVVGQSVTYTATVAQQGGGGATPTGTVTFKDGASTVACTGANPATLSGGSATCTITYNSTSGSPHSITAVYSGDSNYSGTTSTALSQTVNRANTTTTVVSSTNPSNTNQQVTFTATVSVNSPGSGTPTGTVTFTDTTNNVTLCSSSSLSGGQATCNFTFTTAGTRSVQASYNGDTNFNTSSGSVSQGVVQGTATWDGGSLVDSNWTTAANWVGDITPAVGSDLIFPSGAARLTNNNDFANGTTFGSITITGDGYSLGGNSVSLVNGLSATVPAATQDAVTLIVGGASGVTKAGNGTLALTAANTYTGATAVNAGVLNVRNNTALGTTGGATTVANGATVQVQGGLSGVAEPITLNDGGFNASGALENVSGNNVWTGNVTLASGSTIAVDGAADTLTVSGVVGESGGAQALTKAGPGTLVLSGNNTYTGATTVSQGVLNGQTNTAFGTTAGGVSVANGAKLQLQGGTIAVGAEALTLNGGNAFESLSGTNSWAGTITLTADTSVSVVAGQLTASNVIGETAPSALTKTGDGTLVLSGTAADTYTGTTTVNGGELDLSKPAGVNAIVGNLVIGDGTGTDTAKLTNNEQIPDTSSVTVNSSGLFNLNSKSETINALTMTGGSVTTGTGTLTLGGDVVTNASSSTASISGKLAWGATVNRTFTVADGTANPDLTVDVSQTIGSTQGLTKAGDGSMTISTLTNGGTVLVNGGTLSPTVAITNNRALSVASGANLTTASGVDYVQNGSSATSAVNGTITATGATVQINAGRLTGSGTLGPNVNNAGWFLPGNVGVNNGIGILTVSGNYTQTSTGILSIDISGTDGPGSATGNDQLSVSGTAAIAGKIGTSTNNGFVASLGDTFNALPAGGGLSGTFSLFDIYATGSSVYAPNYGANGLTLVVTQNPTVTVSAPAPTNEGSGGGTTPFTFTINRPSGDNFPTTVKFTTKNGTAIAPADYTAVNQQVTFAPFETTKTITVNVNADDFGESDETFTGIITPVQYSTVSPDNNTVTATIVNDDGPAPAASVSDVSQAEGSDGGTTAFTFHVTLTSPSDGNVSVRFRTNDTGTAKASAGDFTAVNTTVTFAAGETDKTVTVLVNADNTVEGDEVFKAVIDSPKGTSIADNTGVGTIVNDD